MTGQSGTHKPSGSGATAPLEESDGASSSATRSVDDGPQRAVGLRDQADAAARKKASQGDGTAKVGSRVLHRALEWGGLAVDNGETIPYGQLLIGWGKGR